MQRLGELITRLFPDRQILLRSNDQVRALKLTRNTQVVMAGLGTLFVGWLLTTSAMVLLLSYSVGLRDARLTNQQTAYDRLVGEVSSYQEKVTAVTRNVRERQAHLLSLFTTSAGTNGNADTAGQRAAREAVESSLHQLDGELDAIAGTALALEENLLTVRHRLTAALAERDQVAAARAELVARLQDEQRRQSGDAERSDSLRENLSRTSQQLSRVTEDRERVAKERDGYRVKLSELEREVFESQDEQQNLIYRLVERASDSVVDAERIVMLTGIKPEAVMVAKLRNIPQSQGGPFMPIDSAARLNEPVQSALTLLDLHLERWDVMQRLLRSIPFAPPLDSFNLTSGFGPRSDPFTQTASMHSGIDMSAPRKTAIYSPAPGTVVFANRKDRYGKMIEIDHGMGVVTRYGHLETISVKPGDKVQFRGLLGEVGSTGRTSGAHLHYEVIVQGQALDPQRFMDVGKYLYKEVDDIKVAKRAPKRPNVARN